MFKRNLFLVYCFLLICSESNSYLRSSFFFRNRSVEAKECQSNSLKGQCMFNFECMHNKGRPIGICFERYYVGSCCFFNASSINEHQTDNENNQIIMNQQQTDHSITTTTSQPNNSLKLRMVNKPNITYLKEQVTKLFQVGSSTKRLTTIKDIDKVSNYHNENLSSNLSSSNHKNDLNIIDFSTNQTIQSTTEENESANFINSTLISSKTITTATTTTTATTAAETKIKSPIDDKLNYSEQIKPINLIDHSDQTTISIEANYLLTNSLNNSTNSQIVLSMQQSTTPIPLNNSFDQLIDKNSTQQQSSISDDDQKIAATTTEQTNSEINSTNLPIIQTSSIEKYFMNLECGRPKKTQTKTAKIVGGRNSLKSEFPWMVLIKESLWFGWHIKTKCGGVLINPSYVLTAAHCQPQLLGSLFVILGEHDLNGNQDRNAKPIIRAVKRIIIHREYNPNTFENDIALLELHSPIVDEPNITPICLPNRENDIFEEATITGFGKLKYGGSIPSLLQVAKLPILSNKACQEMYLEMGVVKKIRDTFLCAGYKPGSQQETDSCEGDSGSPLIGQRSNGQWVLIATVSHGIKCSYLPGIYIRTSSYLTWIYNTIQHNSLENSSKKIVQRLRYQKSETFN